MEFQQRRIQRFSVFDLFYFFNSREINKNLSERTRSDLLYDPYELRHLIKNEMYKNLDILIMDTAVSELVSEGFLSYSVWTSNPYRVGEIYSETKYGKRREWAYPSSQWDGEELEFYELKPNSERWITEDLYYHNIDFDYWQWKASSLKINSDSML